MGSDFVSDLMQRVNGIGERFVSSTYGRSEARCRPPSQRRSRSTWPGGASSSSRAAPASLPPTSCGGSDEPASPRSCSPGARSSFSSSRSRQDPDRDRQGLILNGVTGSTSDPTQASPTCGMPPRKPPSEWWRQRASATSASTSWRRSRSSSPPSSVGFALALLILAKLATWVLLSLGPFFIAWLCSRHLPLFHGLGRPSLELRPHPALRLCLPRLLPQPHPADRRRPRPTRRRRLAQLDLRRSFHPAHPDRHARPHAGEHHRGRHRRRRTLRDPG